ncbi:histidine phosphatase family protein [Candidatus Poriferisodalis sp.]|uniref:histidine phosphatase family protein n=1 Tax=Candidatus Poriferisodalis sp. TaxID=3101277 RepID=UPI003B025862
MLMLVRHGRTSANAAGLLQGRADNELDAVGMEQAEQIAAALSLPDDRPDRILCSPLLRARQTAEATAKLLGLEISVDARWSELDYGEWDGIPVSEIRTERWQRWRADPGFAPPGGESLAELNERVAAACDELAAEAAEGRVAVFTHVSPIKSAVKWTLGTPNEISWHLHVSQAQITRIGFRGHQQRLVSYNDTAHLSDRG